MVHSSSRRKLFFRTTLLLAVTAFFTNQSKAQTASVTPADQFAVAGVSTPFTASALSGLGNTNADKKFDWTITGPSVITGVSETITSGTDNSQNFTFNTVGEYTVSVKITKVNGSGTGNVGDNVTVTADVTVVAAANSPINCSSRFFVSHGSGGGASDATSLKNLSFNGSTITANSFATSPGSIGFNAIGISPDDGYLYGVRYENNDVVDLIKVGAGGSNNVINKGAISGVTTTVFAGCFSAAGTYFFIDNANRFFKLSKAQLNGARVATSIGTLNGTGVNVVPDYSEGKIIDIAINPVNGKMYGVSMGPNSSSNADYRIYEIDTTNGALKRRGSASGTTGQYAHPVPAGGLTSSYIASLFFIEDGTLYGYRSDGQFLKIDTLNPQNSANAGTGPGYTYADGCSCSFRVGHTLTRTVFCPTTQNPTPTFDVKIVVSNSSGSARQGLSFSLPIGDPAKRFRYVDNITTIKNALIAKGFADANSVVSLTATAPATGTNYNTLNVTGFKIPFTPGAANKDSFVLKVQFYTPGGPYNFVSFQSTIGNLPATLGTTDKSGNNIAPQAATVIEFMDCSNITLSSKLLSFKGNLVNSTAALTWETSTEDGVDDYVVQRSFDGTDFSDVGVVGAKGQASSYTFNDPLTSVPEKIYYRLKIREAGSSKYSGIVILRSGTIKGSVVVAPNPFTDNFQFTINSNSTADMNYTLSTVDGKLLKRAAQRLNKGTNTFFVNDLHALQTGIYILTINTGTEVETIKLIKNRQ